jgi:hypothetical protein
VFTTSGTYPWSFVTQIFHTGTPEFTPRFSGVRVTRSLVLYVLSIVVCPFVLFLLAIVLCVLLRSTDYDNSFGIFKFFLQQSCVFQIIDESAVSSTNLTDYFEEITGCLGNVYYEP